MPPSVIRGRAAAALTAAAVAVLLVGCGPDPLPVDPEVSWAGGREPVGPFEDDPRVEVLREAVPEFYAAGNALNYSEPALTGITMLSPLQSAANSDHTRIQSGYSSVRLYEGPPSFAVTDIEETDPEAEIFAVWVCERRSPWWTLEGEVWRYPEKVVEERDGMFRVAQAHYVENKYLVSRWDGRWQIEAFSGGGYSECDPGPDVAVPTFTTPPDLSLLTQATPDMVIGPDGKRLG
jgi:hypothetical protein